MVSNLHLAIKLPLLQKATSASNDRNFQSTAVVIASPPPYTWAVGRSPKGSRLQKLSDRYSQTHALVYLEKSLHKYVRAWNHRYFSGNSYKLFGTLWILFGGMVKSVLFPSPHLTASPCDWNSCKQRPSVKDQRRRVPSWPLLKASGKLMDTSACLEMLAKDSVTIAK